MEKLSRKERELRDKQFHATKRDPLNIRILRSLKEGKTTEQLHLELVKQGFEPNAVRTIEDRLKDLRELFNAKNTNNLVYILGQKGLM